MTDLQLLKIMKTIFIAIALLLGITVYAQEGSEKKNVFVRVFDLQGKKIGKGKILFISDTSLQLKGKRASPIPVNNIGQIKTKHSGGLNLVIGGATGAALFAVLGTLAAEADDSVITSEELAGVALIGGATGAAIGGLTILLKKSNSYEINGDELKLKEFKEKLN